MEEQRSVVVDRVDPVTTIKYLICGCMVVKISVHIDPDHESLLPF